VLALLPLPGGDLIAGGSFTTAGGQPAARIARWNGTSWSPLGSGMNDRVEALELLPNGDLLAGGAFTTAGGVAVNHLARWNGGNWSAVGAGFAGVQSAAVYAIAAQPHGELAVGGNFLTADSVTSAGFARALPTCPATAVPFGTGCAGTGGPDVLVAATLPWVGSTFRAVGSGLPPVAFVSIVYGFTPLQPPLPLSAVLPAALPGCELRVSPDVLDFAVAVGGSLTTTVVLPNTTSLVGVWLLQQLDSFEFDAGFQLVEVTASNALLMTLGVF
jgi:hypothetical protein